MSGSGLHVVHVITGLDTGGAERQLIRLLAAWNRAGMRNSVICLREEGTLSERVRDLGVPLHHLDMRFGIQDVFAPFKMRQLLRRLQPDLVQTWMYHADIFGGLAAKIVGIPCVWNIRQLNLDPNIHSKVTMAMIRLGIRWSHSVPAHILSNSERAKQVHIEAGYAANAFTVISNGVDTDRFQPNREHNQVHRARFGIASDAHVIGHVARFDPQKDHHTLFKGIQRYFSMGHDAVFLIIGRNVTVDNEAIREWLKTYELDSWVVSAKDAEATHRKAILLLGERSDVDTLYPVMDLCTLTSISEASPNVLAEAMSSGVPCVSTDVGEAAHILGDTGAIVPPGDAAQLAHEWHRLCAPDTDQLAHATAARQRVLTHFKTDVVAAQYIELYQRLSGIKV